MSGGGSPLEDLLPPEAGQVFLVDAAPERMPPGAAVTSTGRARELLLRSLDKSLCEDLEAPPAEVNTFGHDDAAAAARLRRAELARAAANEKRAKLWKLRVGDAKNSSVHHERKQLRRKIADILTQVKKRQELARQQERHEVGRAKAAARGGCKTAQNGAHQSGEASQFALGISLPASPRGPGPAPSPRRTAILDSLSLEELDRLRHDPWFYLEGPVPGGSSSAEPSMAASASRSQGHLRGSLEESSQSLERVPEPSLDALVDFFTPTKYDKQVSIVEFTRRLRHRSVHGPPRTPSRRSLRGEVDAEAILRRSSAGLTHAEPSQSSADPFAERSTMSLSMKASVSLPDLSDKSSRMPCHGRHEMAQRGSASLDASSPTFRKVREVYGRRDEIDAAREERRLDSVSERSALSQFKALEQQRERQLKADRQKELSSLRTLEATSRKQLSDDLERRHLEIRQMEGNARMMNANEQAEDLIDERRRKVALQLQLWRSGVERAAACKLGQEQKRHRAAEAKQQAYTERLMKVADAHHNFSDTHAQRNDKLKASVQTSLKGRLEDRQARVNEEKTQAIEARLEAANQRRQQAIFRARYQLVQRAFGEQALGFDAKNFVSIDRRSPSWKGSMDGTSALLGMLEEEVNRLGSLPAVVDGPASLEELPPEELAEVRETMAPLAPLRPP